MLSPPPSSETCAEQKYGRVLRERIANAAAIKVDSALTSKADPVTLCLMSYKAPGAAVHPA